MSFAREGRSAPRAHAAPRVAGCIMKRTVSGGMAVSPDRPFSHGGVQAFELTGGASWA